MNRCLGTAELLDIIIEKLDGDRTSLSCLARVCTSLKEPALNALYYKMDCFEDLLEVIPEDVLPFQQEQPGFNSWNFHRRMARDEWHMFISYTTRVRDIKIEFVDSHMDSVWNVCTVLGWHCSVATLFPNLLKLTVLANHMGSAGQFVGRLCLGKKLQSLVIKDCNTELWLKGLQSSGAPLFSRCPLLEAFECGPDDQNLEYPNASSIVTDSICGWPNLRTLNCGPLEPRSISHVAAMPSFNRLRLALSEETHWPDEGYCFGLRALEALIVDSHDYCSFEKVSKALASLFRLGVHAHPPQASLRHLEVQSTSMSTSSLSTLAVVMASYVFHHTLQKVIIRDGCLFPGRTGRATGISGRDISAWLQTLRPFQRLTHIDLRYTHSPYGEDFPIPVGVLLDCARSWPHLRSLVLWFITTSLTLVDTINLLQVLPKLETLGIGIRMTTDAIMLVVREKLPLPSNAQIDTLAIEHADATDATQDVEPLSTLLVQLVPRLSKVLKEDHSTYAVRADRSPFWVAVLAKVHNQRAA
ncbi:hypothetical protein CONPUDRAFT_151695 [Coniophora puteana RWD-64-598 SS2]|uniref:F-box domain-containing protein n=1 Tax=Coniophora puteana (strain RWD-64-598) TaxID=741705 RepID=A0A5M3MU91_CONPW|nr:uncharacterized protein CONPUDRAFT_151695 [Coniophora puteana RWD-64-598 SS2]EIW82620.1 hypothetical protein CONPUDRAFT_151695 [Coniophora puteana RWD-64-598 SS2]